MEAYELALMQDMSNDQRTYFQSQFTNERKDPPTGLLLCLFLGGLGAHQFYLKKTGLGVLYVLFCWTFVPAFIALVECFLIQGRVRRYNQAKAGELAAQVRMLYARNGTVQNAMVTAQP
ncbi:MAG TPA: NINE protein [Acidobacteriaceae bacterium]|nr:NINE protein [Acidobacteriaceae bacterium]